MTNKKIHFANHERIRRRSHMSAVEERFPIHDHNENSQLCLCDEYRRRFAERTIEYSSIQNFEIDGFPICITRNEGDNLEATFCKNSHAMIVGTTGSGKTTGFVLPFLNWMPKKKNKPTIIVSDPKNELNELTANRFIENGYRVVWLNFQDYTSSDCWNPLTKIYRLYQKYLNVDSDVRATVKNGKAYNRFRGGLFTSQKALDSAILAEKDRIIAEVSNMIGSIAEAISPTVKESDPYWDNAAASLLMGFLWAMLEDSAPEKERGRITEETYTFDTILKIYDSFEDTHSSLNDHGYFSHRDPETSKAYQLAYTNIIDLSATTTRSCITSCFSEKIKKFRDTSVRRITCANTIDIDRIDDDDRPTVIFISYKDEDSLHYEVISLFISDLYTSLIAAARRNNGKLKRTCYFLLDEFGNFPRFKDFENVISACRSRDIWFLLIVQSYAQLNRVYKKETADIILDNLNMHIFFGSCNYDTKAAFSRECGIHDVSSALSAINSSDRYIDRYTNEQAPLVPISSLSQLNEGECIITQLHGDVIRAKIERSYLCREYRCGKSKMTERMSPISFFDPRYNYDMSWLMSAGRRRKASPFDL